MNKLAGLALVAVLIGTSASLFAQAHPNQWPNPSPAIGKLLDEALKIKDADPRIAALKKVLDAAKAANDAEGQAESEKDLGSEFEGRVSDLWLGEPVENLGSAPDAKTAISWFEAALTGFKTTGNRRCESEVLISLGSVYCGRLRQVDKAKQYHAQALAIARQLGDRELQGKALSRIGFDFHNGGDLQTALARYNQALPLARSIADRKTLMFTLMNAGNICYDTGQPRKLLEYMREALPIARAQRDRWREGGVVGLMGLAYENLRQMDKALEFHGKAREIAKEIGDRIGLMQALNNLGMDYRDLDDFQKALDCYSQSLTIAKEIGDENAICKLLVNCAETFEGLGQYERALDNLNQALPVAKELGDLVVFSEILTNLGSTYSGLEQHQQALTSFERALPITRQRGDRVGEANILVLIGDEYRSLGQAKKALVYCNQALSMARELGDKPGEGSYQLMIGECYEDVGRNRTALVHLNQALRLLKAAEDREDEAETLFASSQALASERRPGLAIVFAKQSVNVYQDLRKAVSKLSRADQDTYAKTVEPTYRYLADLLIKQGRLREAETVMNLLKDHENFEFVARDSAAAGGVEGRMEAIGAEGGWWNRYQVLQDRALKIDSDEFELTQKASKLKSAALLTAEQKLELSRMEIKLKEVDAQKEVIDKAADAYFDEVGKQAAALGEGIRKEAETRIRQTGDELPSLLERIHRESGERVGAVYALASTDELDFLVVTYAGRAHLSVPVTSGDLNTMISALRKDLMNPNVDPRPQGEKLYHLAFEKLIHQLHSAGCTRVVWCLDGTLRYVPVGALWDGKKYLIESDDFTMFDPLNLDRVASEATKNLQAAGFAATEGKGPDFAPLPGADAELKSVVKDESQAGFMGAVPGRAHENKGFDASSLEAAMRGEQFSLLHIATHFNVGKDFNSSDLLLGDGKLLSLKAFTDVGSHGRLGHLDLVCLSACDTAESFGDAVSAGSQFSSFVSLTLKDGASSVVASLWPVSDASTPLLMKRFYESWMAHKDKGKAEALRMAQLSLLYGESRGVDGAARSVAANSSPGSSDKLFVKDPKRPFEHPYYWAPFVLFGNWK